MKYEINLTQAENLALTFAAISTDEWIQNYVQNRCRIAMDEIVAIAVQKCFDSGMQIPSTKDEIVELAFAQGWVKTAAQVHAEFEAAQAVRIAAEAQAQ